MRLRSLIYMVLAAALLATPACMRDDVDDYGYSYVSGQKTRVRLNIGVPAMSVATRSDMLGGKDYEVQSLWIGVFSARSGGKCTYAALITDEALMPSRHKPFKELTIETLSGPSYIVAVANPVDNFGYAYDPANEFDVRTPLDALLPHSTAEASKFTWESYKNLAIRQLDMNDISTPIDNLVMSGIYYESEEDPTARDWERLNYTSVIIPASTNGGTVELPGAVHLRRLISQVKFDIRAVEYPANGTPKGSGSTRRIVEVTPQSYQVKNVPYTSWLHERPSPASVEGAGDNTANSGDFIRHTGYAYQGPMSKRQNYRTSAWFNGNQYITSYKYDTDANGQGGQTAHTFDFWMLENKRWAAQDLYSAEDKAEERSNKAYDRREKEIKRSETLEGTETTIDRNTGIYTALCGDGGVETMNNCAAFVEIRCRVLYTEEGLGAIQNDTEHPEYNDVQYRSAEAIYTVHLGGINQQWNDFTHRRNHVYTYKITVMDIDRIIVEAMGDDGEARPGIEGVVTDVINPPFDVDCHYAKFNIKLSNLERTGGGIEQGDGVITGGENSDKVNGGKYEGNVFPFRVRYYDNTNFARYIDQNNLHEYMSKDSMLYWTWIEIRPTTDSATLACYKPYGKLGEVPGADGKTFRLNEVADIENYPHFKDTAHKPEDEDQYWYTVFVNEYVYEHSTDESENNWVNYVNLSPRMCWLNTLFRSSADDESNYIRSKYVVRQQSIQTFYSIPAGRRAEDIDAIGMEHTNETFGFNLRWDDVTTKYSAQDPAFEDAADPRSHDIKNNNGRHNTLLYIGGTPTVDNNGFIKGASDESRKGGLTSLDWDFYLDRTTLQLVTGFNTNANQTYLEDIPDPKVPYYLPAIYTYKDPASDTNMGSSNINTENYLRILDACMNRNRDNNGNGKIDLDEIRWYVPGSSEIVDLVLGRNSLTTPLLDYNLNYYLNSPDGGDLKTELPHQSNTRFHYATSNQRVLWAEEGTSINPEVDKASRNSADNNKWDWNLPPQQVRCVRALGTNLGTDANNDLSPAFEVDNKTAPTKIYPTFYEQKNQRARTSTFLEPHQEMTTLNRLCYNGFEFSPELYTFEPDSVYIEDKRVETIPAHWSEPAGYYAADGTYLGATLEEAKTKWMELCGVRYYGEWHEGEYHEAGMYLPDPNNRSDKAQPGYAHYEKGFWTGKRHVAGGYYKPNVDAYSETEKEGYEHWDAFTLGGEPHDAGMYKPNPDTYSPTEFPGSQYWQNGFWTGKRNEQGYYKPDPSQYSETEKKGYERWEAFSVGGEPHDAGMYKPNPDSYSPTQFPGSQEWQNGFWTGDYHQSGKYAPDEKSYAGAGDKPNDGYYYEWWNEYLEGAIEYKPGYYWPDPSSGPNETPDDTYILISEDFGDDYYGPGDYTIIVSNYSTEYKWGYAHFTQPFWYNNVQYPAGYYELTRGGNFYFNGPGFWVGGKYPAGYYARDVNRLITYDNQLPNGGNGYPPLPRFNTSMFVGGTKKPAGWYRPDPSSGPSSDHPGAMQLNGFYDGKYYQPGWYGPDPDSRDPSNDYWNADDRYKRFEKFSSGGTVYPAGWYRPDSSTYQKDDPNEPGYKQCQPFCDGDYYEPGWYGPDPDSLDNDSGDAYYHPDTDCYKRFEQFWTGGTEYPAGWYRPDGSTYQQNDPKEPGYKQCQEFYEGDYYGPGYYGPDPDSRDRSNDYWNADPRYQRFGEFWDVMLPGGYYKNDGTWYGDNENDAKDKCWSEGEPTYKAEGGGKWIEEETKEVDYSRWKYTGSFNDPRGGTSNLFIYNEGSFVADHGATLDAANKLCRRKKGEGWRLPNMKEAALIKIALENAGFYKTRRYNADNSPYYTKENINGYDIGNYLSCTFREFGVDGQQSRGDQTGYYTGVYYPEIAAEASEGDYCGDQNQFLMGRIACITTQWNRHYYIRCVRDLESAAGN